MVIRVLLAATLVVCVIVPSHAAEPVPPLMTTLMSVFPEGNGWFVDGPLDTVPGMPEDVRPFYQRPRVLAPDLDALQIAVGKLFAASSRLPLKKVTRYDEKPGVDGLPGMRGIWCETEDEAKVGFLILTPNQNRFLIWAKRHFYPVIGDDDIPRKVRNQHVREISDYLASIDFKVPDYRVPLAAARELPPSLDLYPEPPAPALSTESKLRELMAAYSEIAIWGWSGLTAFVPSEETIDRFITSATETLFVNKEAGMLQTVYREFAEAGGSSAQVNVLTRTGFDTLAAGAYIFAIDRYGRARIALNDGVNRHALLFPGLPVLTAGEMELRRAGEQPVIHAIGTDTAPFFYSRFAETIRDDVAEHSDDYLLSLGHLYVSLKVMRIPAEGVLIRKF